GTATETTTATSASPVGTYPITFSTESLAAANYTFTYVNGTLTISGGAAQTITFNPLSPVTYGVAPITLTATASSGLPVSYTFTGPATLSGSTLTITGAGSVTVTASQAGNATYAAATPVQQTLTVNKASLTVTANNAGMVYGQPVPSFTYTITAFVNGDTSAVVSGTATETTTATSASPVGTYPITFSTESLAAANYTFTYVNGTLTISSATQTITFNPLAPVTYGVAPITLTATASSGLPVSYTVTGPATLSGSTLTITGAGSVTVTASQAGNTNYAAATPVQRTLTVNKASLTVTANNAGITSGQPLPSFTYTITGFVNGDTSAVVSGTATEATTATSASPVGTYPITFSTELLAAANYTFTYVNGTLTISGATPPPAFVQGTSNRGFGAGSLSATFTGNVVSGDMIAVMTSATGAGATNVTSSCSGSFTKVDSANNGVLNTTGSDWYAPATSTGSCKVTATFSGSPSRSSLLITEISGVTATNPLDAHSAMNQDQPTLAANAITSGTSTTTQAGDYIWGATVSPNDSYGTVSAGTGFTLSQALASGETVGEYEIQSAAGPVSATFTDTADQYLHIQTFMMAFAPGGGSSTGNTCPQNLAIGTFTLCGESYNDVSSGTNVQVNYSPSSGNGIIAWATWCFTSACNTSISGVTATIGDNINATESCFAVSPHSPFITDANGGGQGSGDFQQHYVWYCPSVPSGVTSFTVTPSNPSLAYLQLNITEWKAGSLAASCSPISACFENVDNSGQAGNSTGGTTATITTSGSTVNANDLIFAATEVSCCSFTASPGAGYTGITVAPSVTPGMVSEAKAATATGIQTATSTWTGGSTPWFGVIVPIKGAGTAQTITFNPLSPVTYGVAPITLTATASSGLPVSYTFTGPATLSGSTLTITGAGSVTVTASQAGNATYAAAAPVQQILTVNKAL
ncbi:MAG: MBG domain-containing protein, partial [Candidatus Acidiferrales bacterium]